MNIGADEVDGIGALIRESAIQGEFLYPTIRGRIVAINDLDAKTWRAQKPHLERRMSSGRNLTWMQTLPSNNVLAEGQWWNVGDTEPQVSLEQEYAQDLGLRVGDKMTFDIGGQQISVRGVVDACPMVHG